MGCLLYTSDTLSEFLVMAATLLDIKSKMLLPKKEEEEQEQEDPRAELVQQLLEYKICLLYTSHTGLFHMQTVII